MHALSKKKQKNKSMAWICKRKLTIQGHHKGEVLLQSFYTKLHYNLQVFRDIVNATEQCTAGIYNRIKQV